mmetsp:Transcript_9823/g.28858  ORF Transcript_9823/g.28858 Transcript_9823/m.28858 type:complete len:417 (-) Transcript_9823:2570-3820(-)
MFCTVALHVALLGLPLLVLALAEAGVGLLVLAAVHLLPGADRGVLLERTHILRLLDVCVEVLALSANDGPAHILNLPLHALLAHAALLVLLGALSAARELHAAEELLFRVAALYGVVHILLQVLDLQLEVEDGVILLADLNLVQAQLFGAEVELRPEVRPLVGPGLRPALADLLAAQFIELILELGDAQQRLRLKILNGLDAPLVELDAALGVGDVLPSVRNVPSDVLDLFFEIRQNLRALFHLPGSFKALIGLLVLALQPGAHDDRGGVVASADGVAPELAQDALGEHAAHDALQHQRRRLLVASLHLFPEEPRLAPRQHGLVQLLDAQRARPLALALLPAALLRVAPKLRLDLNRARDANLVVVLALPQLLDELAADVASRGGLDADGAAPLQLREVVALPPLPRDVTPTHRLN